MDTTKTRPEGQNRKPRPSGDRPQGTKKRPEEAARVRQEAEETLFGEVVAHYERWKCMADADPSWAARNPIHVEVQKDTDHSLHVTCYPAI